MEYRLETHSINGGTYLSNDTWPSVMHWKHYVEKNYRTVTCYWRVWILDSAGNKVMMGTRGGYNATGKNWIWELA